jgi:SAM-dependent methyltransferase
VSASRERGNEDSGVSASRERGNAGPEPRAAPPLPAAIDTRFQAWLAAAAGRASLRFPEIRKGVQALSARYVEGRKAGGVGAGALGGAGLRTAFASFYAPLHFLTAFAAANALPASLRAGVTRVVDLGAGTGAVGAALALAAGGAEVLAAGEAEVLALDRSAWALGEARHTFAAFAVRGRTRRAELPAGVPRLAAGDLVAAGWLLNEGGPAWRARLGEVLTRALDAGARVLVLEPLARGVSPWWDDFAAALAPAGAASALLKWSIERPDWIARLDAAAGLDHREIGARVLWGPAPQDERTSE